MNNALSGRLFRNDSMLIEAKDMPTKGMWPFTWPNPSIQKM